MSRRQRRARTCCSLLRWFYFVFVVSKVCYCCCFQFCAALLLLLLLLLLIELRVKVFGPLLGNLRPSVTAVRWRLNANERVIFAHSSAVSERTLTRTRTHTHAVTHSGRDTRAAAAQVHALNFKAQLPSCTTLCQRASAFVCECECSRESKAVRERTAVRVWAVKSESHATLAIAAH